VEYGGCGPFIGRQDNAQQIYVLSANNGLVSENINEKEWTITFDGEMRSRKNLLMEELQIKIPPITPIKTYGRIVE